MEHPDMHDVLQLYQMQIGPLSGAQREKLYQAYDEGMSPFVIGCAILRTSQEQKRRNLQGQPKRISFNYLWGIIQDWLLHGITTESAFRAYWQGQQGNSSHHAKGGKTGAVQSSRQVFGKDYQYTQRTSAVEGFFSFVDD
ncbi:MAG: DnaD domain protein [Firmicutes bacterium]|nr:DnaD domain protein [Bacillota bacterium]